MSAEAIPVPPEQTVFCHTDPDFKHKVYESMNVHSVTTAYDAHRTEAAAILETAHVYESEHKSGEALDCYRRAASKYLSCISVGQLTEATTIIDAETLAPEHGATVGMRLSVKDSEPTDPFVLLQYARCIFKQVEYGQVSDYHNPLITESQIDGMNAKLIAVDEAPKWSYSRIVNLQRIASETFDKAWKVIMEAPEFNDTRRFAGALVAADGFRSMDAVPKAVEVLEKASEVLDTDEDTNPELHKFFEQPLPDMLTQTHELADQALADIANDSEEVLALI